MKILKTGRAGRQLIGRRQLRGVRIKHPATVIDEYSGRALSSAYLLFDTHNGDIYVGRSGQTLSRLHAHLSGNSGNRHGKKLAEVPRSNLVLAYLPGDRLPGDRNARTAEAERLMARVVNPNLSRCTTRGRYAERPWRPGRRARQAVEELACCMELQPQSRRDPLRNLRLAARLADEGHLDELSPAERLDVAVGAVVGSPKLMRPLRNLLERLGFWFF